MNETSRSRADVGGRLVKSGTRIFRPVYDAIQIIWSARPEFATVHDAVLPSSVPYHFKLHFLRILHTLLLSSELIVGGLIHWRACGKLK